MKLSLFSLLLFLFINNQTTAQVSDMPCSQGIFYVMEGSSVRKFNLNGTTITDLGIITSFSGNSAALVYANDIINGSVNRTLYASRYNFITNIHDIIQYDGTAWNTVTTDSIVYHNGGGYGNFIYFQHSGTPNIPNDQCISRLNSNGTLTKIFTDTSLVFTVADVVVNSQGHVFFFRGPAIGNTTQMTELDPQGNIVNTFSTTLNNLSTLWGAAMINNQIFIGWGTTNTQLFPLNISGSTASFGTAIQLSSNSFKDLASCHDSLETASLSEYSNKSIQIFPNPTSNGVVYLNHLKAGTEISVINMNGQLVAEPILINSEEFQLNIQDKGTYFICLKTKEKIAYHKIVRL